MAPASLNLAAELDAALDAISAAGAEVLRLYASFAKIADAPADITTDADRASQEIILQRLARRFPNDALCGEESTPSISSTAGKTRLWIVDPIDGTRGFARKNDEFAIMIGLVDAGEVVLGVVSEPAIGRVTYASRGAGCHVITGLGAGPHPCRVTTTATLKDAVLSISRSQKAEGEKRILDGFGAARAVQTYSAGIKLGQVARGETDLYLGDYLTLKDWDVCAGHILVTEAGGTVTNVDGGAIAYDGSGRSLASRGILATNGKLHATCLEVLRTGAYCF